MREKNITRTVDVITAELTTYDTTKKEIMKVSVNVYEVEEKHLKKALEKRVAPDIVLSIDKAYHAEVKYSMPLSTFIKYAEVE